MIHRCPSRVVHGLCGVSLGSRGLTGQRVLGANIASLPVACWCCAGLAAELVGSGSGSWPVGVAHPLDEVLGDERL